MHVAASSIRKERLLAILTALAVLMSLMVIYADPALAHHPRVSASDYCDQDGLLQLEITSFSWTMTPSGYGNHDDVRVEVLLPGSSSWTQVGSGAYTAADPYRTFTVNLDGNTSIDPADLPATTLGSLEGQTIGIRSQVVDTTAGPGVGWYNDSGTYNPNAGTGNGNNEASMNLTLTECEPPDVPVSVTVTPQSCVADGEAIPGSVTVVIDPESGAMVQVTGPGGPYDFSGSGGSQTLAPGDYSWTATAAEGYILDGDASGNFTVDPCNSSVAVGHNQCDVNSSGAPVGSVDVTIDPDSGAVVYVYDDAAMQPADLVATFTGTGGSQELAPGTYYWDAEAGSNFTLTGETSGSFTIDPCQGAVVVTSGDCVLVEGVPFGTASVTIDPESSATVYIYDDADMDPEDLVATVTGSGDSSDTVPPGTYYWEAVAAEGFTLSGDTSGSFTVEPCVAAVAVASGACVIDDQGAPAGSVSATIDVDGSATVNVYDADTDALVASFSGTGGSSPVAPGDYYWEALPEEGFELAEPTSGEFTIEPCDVAVSAIGGECVVTEGGVAVAEVQVSINPDSGATVTIYDSGDTPVASFTENGTVVLEPGDYSWEAVAAAGFEMSGSTSGELTIEPCDTTVAVSGECVVGGDGTSGVISVAISDGIEKVDIYDGAVLIATVTESGDIGVPEGRTYTWLATVSPGFDIAGDSAGAVVIEDCVSPVSVVVSHGHCTDDTYPNGDVEVTLDPELGATVTVVDGQSAEVAVFTTSGSVALAPGNYTWSAEAAEGFELVGPASGSFTVDPCPDEVLPLEVLPFTGMDAGSLFGLALVLLIAGWYATRVANRREEDG